MRRFDPVFPERARDTILSWKVCAFVRVKRAVPIWIRDETRCSEKRGIGVGVRVGYGLFSVIKVVSANAIDVRRPRGRSYAAGAHRTTHFLCLHLPCAFRSAAASLDAGMLRTLPRTLMDVVVCRGLCESADGLYLDSLQIRFRISLAQS